MWERYARATEEGDPGQYRHRPSWSAGGPRWDPYDKEQSRARRATAARRKPRPHRPASATDGSGGAPGGLSYYDLLGVPRSATSDEIEQAYRRYVAEAHPDKFFDDPHRREQAQEKLKQVNAVMQVLRDPVRRRRYDVGDRG